MIILKNHILPEKIHILNVSFLVPDMRREFGGCAGNIAFNLTQLGAECYAIASVGHDFESYAKWMDASGVSRRFVLEEPEEFTAHAYITTDMDDNQITAFHPGAMSKAHHQNVPDDLGGIGIISPNTT